MPDDAAPTAPRREDCADHFGPGQRLRSALVVWRDRQDTVGTVVPFLDTAVLALDDGSGNVLYTGRGAQVVGMPPVASAPG